MNVNTGKKLSGLDHLKQSVGDILTTPIGTRVMLRDYGSNLFELIDKPATDETYIDIKSAVASALSKWETRISLKKINVIRFTDGSLELDLYAVHIQENTEVILDGIIIK